MRASIIIPVFNSAPYLRRCLDSLLQQTYGGIKEIILVDDGSTDASGMICDEYAQKCAEIAVYHTDNRGASLARRYGLEKASGEYVVFVDSDDCVSRNYLSVLVDLIKEFNVTMGACNVKRVNEGSLVIDEQVSQSAYILEGDELFHRFYKYEFWGFGGKVYKRELLMSIAFPEATLSEDYYVMAQLFQAEKRMAYTPTALYYYEQHDSSLSHQCQPQRAFDELINVRDVYTFTVSLMPEYRMYAFSNLVETIVKLLWQNKPVLDGSQSQELIEFLKRYRKDIIHCKQLNRKTAILAIILSCRL